MAALFAVQEPTTAGTWLNVFWTFGPTVLALFTVVVIGSMVLRPAGFGSRILSYLCLANPTPRPVLRRLLWRLPIYLLLTLLITSLWVSVPVGLTMLAAYLSFRFVERAPTAAVPPKSRRASCSGARRELTGRAGTLAGFFGNLTRIYILED